MTFYLIFFPIFTLHLTLYTLRHFKALDNSLSDILGRPHVVDITRGLMNPFQKKFRLVNAADEPQNEDHDESEAGEGDEGHQPGSY